MTITFSGQLRDRLRNKNRLTKKGWPLPSFSN